MTYFIAFKMTREGSVIEANEMYCSEDEARERARELATNAPVELWRRNAWRGMSRSAGRRGDKPLYDLFIPRAVSH